MKTALAAPFALAFAIAACTPSQQDSSAREWQRAECNRVIDKEDRDRCLKRVDDAYGGTGREAPKKPEGSRY